LYSRAQTRNQHSVGRTAPVTNPERNPALRYMITAQLPHTESTLTPPLGTTTHPHCQPLPAGGTYRVSTKEKCTNRDQAAHRWRANMAWNAPNPNAGLHTAIDGAKSRAVRRSPGCRPDSLQDVSRFRASTIILEQVQLHHTLFTRQGAVDRDFTPQLAGHRGKLLGSILNSLSAAGVG